MLIGLFLFSSCKDPNTIGLDLEPGYAIDAQLYSGAAITSHTEKDDPANTSALVRHPLGQMTDDVFGVTTASTAMTVNTPSADYRFGKNPVIDSAVLILPYSSQFYGDSTQTYNIKVNQLTVDMTTQKTFLSNQVWPHDESVVLGTYSGMVKPNTKFKVTDIVTGKADTLKVVVPQIRIKLNNTLIQQKILQMDTLILGRNARFIDNFKGLYASATATGPGGMPFINFSGSDAKLQIFYKKDATTAPNRDTVVVDFPIATGTGPVASTITHAYRPGSDLSNQLANPTGPQSTVTYLQAMSGVRNRLNFDFTAFKASLAGQKIAINKAELVIDVSPTSDVYFTPAQRLTLYRLDLAGQRANVPDNDNSISNTYRGDPRALGSEALFGGYFDAVNARYIFSITSYVQDLIDGKTLDNSAYLAPTPLSEFNVSPIPTSAARSILLQPQTTAAAGTTKGMKLNIYYTKVN